MKKLLHHILRQLRCKFWKRSCHFFIKVVAYLLLLVAVNTLFIHKCIAQEDHAESKFARHIRNLHEELLEKGKTTDQLSESDLASLPIGVMKYIGGTGYMVIIDSAVFTPQGAFFSAYTSLEHKSSGRQLAFAGKNIAFHPGGISNSTESRMYLVDKAQLPFGNKITIELHPQGNYVAFDCNGFKEVHLKGQMAFDRSLMLPEDQQGNLMEGKVKADIAFSATDFGNLLAAVRLPTFRVPALSGISFQVEDAVVDMSDMANPQGMLFPAAYFQSHGQNSVLWEGIYLRKVRIGLFRELDENNQRRYVYGENLVIDKIGLSGTLSVAQIFGQEEGNMNGWPFSVDSLGITFIKNQLGGAAFKGKLQIPIFSKESPIHYTAAVFQEKEETNFRFALQPGKTMKVPALAANLVLAPNSTLIISKHEGKFKPEAILHGSLSVNQSEKASFNNIAFTDLHIASEKPYIRNGYWSLKGSGAQKAANYPIVLKEIDFLHDAQGQLSLRVDALLNLMEGSSGFSAETVISVKGEIVEETNTEREITTYKQTWKYKETAISDIRIEADMEAYKLEGRLSLYDTHEIYGKGFRGEINASFTAAPTMKAVAQFGNVHDMRYWYVDAMFSSPTVMAPAMPGFGIYGFGGGMYYHMKVQQEDIETSELKAISGEQDKYAIGTSRSGATYVPDQHAGLGLKATVALGTVPTPKPFNGDATFEMAFKSSGGLSYIGFRGEGYFMQEISERSRKAPVYAELDINYDFQNRALHAQLDSYINIGKVVRGTQYGGFAGRAIMHFDPQDWYIWLGSPSRPMGLNFLNIAEAQGYFMAGTQIEDILPMDSKVQEIINGVDFGSRKLEAASGKGFAFGSKFNSSFGNEHTTFFGYFDIGAGFDVMLRDYGNLSCEGSTNPIGINGWYASGQAWGYLQGAVGVNVNFKYVKGRFEAFKIAGAYALEARLPNPIWLHGAVAGKFNVLGGLVKGNCHFEVEIGEQCQMQEGNPLGTEVIAELSPVNANEELNVFTTPQATFNITLDEEIVMREEEKDTRTYRIKIDHFKITHDGKTLAGAIEWNDDHNVAIFRTEDILPPKSTIKAEVQIRWEEKVNGSWKAMPEKEQKTVSFKTGIAPDVISPENVAYSYPIAQQSNFYPKEHAQGYMKLKTGQDYLFSTQENGNQWKHYARFSTSGQKDVETPLSYNSTTNLLSFAIPDKLKNDKMYRLSFVKTPQTKQSIDQNVRTKDQNIINNEQARIDMEVKEVKSNLVMDKEKELYSLSYRTSVFDTFIDKLNTFSNQGTYGKIDNKAANLARLRARYHAPREGFDAFELGSGDISSLVILEAVTTTDWYEKHPYPHIYEYYSQYKNVASIDWRQPESLGVPPLKGMHLQSLGNTPPNTSILEGSSTAGLMDFHYDFSYYVYKDYADLYASLVYRSRSTGLGNASKGVKQLVSTHYQDVLGGNYNIKVAYRLPGTGKMSSSKTFTFTW